MEGRVSNSAAQFMEACYKVPKDLPRRMENIIIFLISSFYDATYSSIQCKMIKFNLRKFLHKILPKTGEKLKTARR